VAKVFKYILDFQAQTEKFGKDVGGMTGMLKGAAIAAGAFFAADKIMQAADAVADYAVEISKVRTEIATITGAQGAALDVMTGQVKALADSYEQDVSGTLKATNAIMREFGESGQKAFDILNAGFASSANSGGDFTQQILEYSTHFREAGASAEQMLAVIAESNKMGVFSDKAADSIKEGGIRLREMTQSTRDALNMIGLSASQVQADISSGNKSMFEVMQLVSKQLQTLPQQSPAVGAALADIFGGPGEDAVNFIRALGDMDLSMQAVVDNATKSQMEWTAELAEFHAVGAQVFGGTSQLLTEIKTAFLSWTNSAIIGMVDLTNYFIDLYNESMVFRGAIEYIAFGFKQAWEAVKLVLGLIWENMKATGKMIKAVFTLDWDGMKEAWKTGFSGIVDVAKTYGTNTAENFMDAWNNTLTPREKIALISISEGDATAAGIDAGKNFAAGIKAGVAAMANSPVVALTAKGQGGVKARDEKAVKKDKQESMTDVDKWSTQLASMDAMLDANQQKVDDWKNALIEKQMAVQGAFEQGFAAIGASIVDGLGLAEDGLEGFIGALAETAISLISMMLAQSLANSIAGATMSGTATGPAAIFTTPAFIATAIAGVLGAFAAIPAFASGGIVSGPTLGLMGEYPGASSNPEVIAPLSKLKEMIGGGSGQTIILQPSIDMGYDSFRIKLNQVNNNVRKRT